MADRWRKVKRLLRRLTGWFQPHRLAPPTGPSLVHPAAMGFPGGLFRRVGLPAEQEQERREICTELAEMEALALRQLAEAQENLEKIRDLQKRAGCVPLGLN